MREITIKHKARNTKKKAFIDDETNLVLDDGDNEVDMRFWTYDPSPQFRAAIAIICVCVVFLIAGIIVRYL